MFKSKMMSFIYKSDLLLLFGLVLFFGALFNFLTWLHEPPDGTKIDLSDERRKALIEEWRQKHEKEIIKRLKTSTDHQPKDKNGGMSKNEAKFENNDVALDDSMNQNYGGDDMVNGDLNDNNQEQNLGNNDKKTKQELRDLDFEIAHNDNDKYEAMYVIKENTLNQNINKDSENQKQKRKNEFRNNKREETEAVNENLNIDVPMGGKLVGGPAQCTLYDLSKNISADYECLYIAIKPTVKVCLYPTKEDIHISQHIRNVGLWEPHIVKEVQNILFSNPDYGFIDIGANIGQYSLIAARMGHTVVAVEPYIENIKHLHMAVQLGGLHQKITVIRNAISDKRVDQLPLWVDPVNHGGIRLDKEVNDPCTNNSCSTKSIYMDDLLEVINFQKAVMKIDIEGHEHRALIHSQLLFQKVFISHIIMEWMQLRAYYGAEVDQSENKDLTYDLVSMLHHRGYKAYSLVTGVLLNSKYWFSWPDDIIWKHELEEFN